MFTLEKIMRVWDDKEGVFIEIRQNPDMPLSGIEIHTNGSVESKQWFGPASVTINSKDQVIKLAHALLEMAEQIKD